MVRVDCGRHSKQERLVSDRRLSPHWFENLSCRRPTADRLRRALHLCEFGGIAVQSKSEGNVGRRERIATDDGATGGEIQTQWARVRARLREEFGEAAYRSWLRSMTLFEVADGRARIGVPTRFLREWIAAHYSDRIRALWSGENAAVSAVDV